jgi:phosphate transport system protein
MHINIHLERMADLCTNTAKFVKLAPSGPFSEEIVREVVEMGRQGARMLEVVIQAFAERDLQKALSLPNLDEVIDRLNRSLFKKVAQQFSGTEEEVEWGSRAAWSLCRGSSNVSVITRSISRSKSLS